MGTVREAHCVIVSGTAESPSPKENLSALISHSSDNKELTILSRYHISLVFKLQCLRITLLIETRLFSSPLKVSDSLALQHP